MIPATAHFVWLGPTFPWFNVLAIRSALDRGGFTRVVIHHDRPPHAGNWEAVLSDGRVQARRVDVQALCAEAGLAAAPYEELLQELEAPSARSNVLRCLALAGEGGVYLDTDTITVRALDDLRAHSGFFCGQERIARPARWLHSARTFDRLRSLALMGIRHGFRLCPRGYLGFRIVEGLYPLAVNNAVLGSTPRHPFLMQLLADMVSLPAWRRKRRYALGTHLLQDEIARYEGQDVEVYPPEYFYPLGPEIADHWFRHHSRHDLAQVISPQTRVVHWYGSNHRKRQMMRLDPDYVRRYERRQMLSQLAAPFVSETRA